MLGDLIVDIMPCPFVLLLLLLTSYCIQLIEDLQLDWEWNGLDWEIKVRNDRAWPALPICYTHYTPHSLLFSHIYIYYQPPSTP